MRQITLESVSFRAFGRSRDPCCPSMVDCSSYPGGLGAGGLGLVVGMYRPTTHSIVRELGFGRVVEFMKFATGCFTKCDTGRSSKVSLVSLVSLVVSCCNGNANTYLAILTTPSAQNGQTFGLLDPAPHPESGCRTESRPQLISWLVQVTVCRRPRTQLASYKRSGVLDQTSGEGPAQAILLSRVGCTVGCWSAFLRRRCFPTSHTRTVSVSACWGTIL